MARYARDRQGARPAAGAAWVRRGALALLLALCIPLGWSAYGSDGATGDNAQAGVLQSPTSAGARETAGGAVLPNGRRVSPVGRLFTLGDFPLGLALSPDGRLVVAINSGQGYGLNPGKESYCTNGGRAACPYTSPAQTAPARTAGDPATRTADQSLSVVDLQTGMRSTVTTVPTSYNPATRGREGTFNYLYTGVVFSPDGRHLYAAGGGNDAVYDFAVAGGAIGARPARTFTVPDPGISGLGALFPALRAAIGAGYTRNLAVTPDGRYLLVTHEIENALAVIDTSTGVVRQLSFGPPLLKGVYPAGVAVAPNGRTAYVALQGTNAIATVALGGGMPTLVGTIPAGDHPTALALSRDGSQLYVANANDDTLSVIATASGRVAATIRLAALTGEATGAIPDAVCLSPDGSRIYVALAGDNAVAVVGVPSTLGAPGGAGRTPKAPDLAVQGYIPAGWYPSAVATDAAGTLYVVSAKGLGSAGRPIRSSFEYDANTMAGLLQVVPSPAPDALAADTGAVRQDIQAAAGADSARNAHNPIPATAGGATPIRHVVLIVRENRTFDQVLGDVGADQGRGRSQIDGEPSYAIFGRAATPNAHALVGDPLPGTGDPAFATGDAFYSDGEASIQGHYWTSSASVSDYIERTWRQYYSPRHRAPDAVSSLGEPRNCSIFQAALRQQAGNAGFSFRDFGELVGTANSAVAAAAAGQPIGNASPGVPERCRQIPGADITLAGGSNLQLDVDNRATARVFLADSGLDAHGAPAAGVDPATHYLRNFSYILMTGDHTGGLQFKNTPRSRVAQNDAGLGLIVQALSHSRYWDSTAIFVMEDDSQDGLDHVDGHRNVLYVISPYAKHAGEDGKPGYIGHRHYSQVSVLKTIELLCGLPPLSSYDQHASALYDLFQNKDRSGRLTAADLRPFTLQPAPAFIDETSARYGASAGRTAAPVAAASRNLYLGAPDSAGPLLEAINWRIARPGTRLPAPLQREMSRWRPYAFRVLGQDGF